MKICICGGGSLGLVSAGILSSHEGVEVSVLTNRPSEWGKCITITDTKGIQYIAEIALATNSPAETIPQADMVFICQPGFLIEKTLRDIKPYLKNNTIVGSIVASTGFFFTAHEVLEKTTPLFAFQRTPFIARVKEYGHSANLLGYKPQVAIAAENIADVEAFRQMVERLFITPTVLKNSYYEVSLTNSNPIRNTGRLYSMWHDCSGEVFDHNILFYKEWNNDASQMVIDMDTEFMTLLQKLPIEEGAVPPLLEYYESHDAPSLTRKISSIPAFQTIESPMKRIENGWIPDFESRYFTEDFPYGLRYIWSLAKELNVPIPTIEKVYKWGMSKIEK